MSYRQSFQNQKQGGGNNYKQGGGYNNNKFSRNKQKSEFVPSINTGNLFDPQDKAIQENHVGRGTIVLDFDLLSENTERMKVRVGKDGGEETREVVKLFINSFDNGKNVFVTFMPVNAVANQEDEEEEQPRQFTKKPAAAPAKRQQPEPEEEEEEEEAPWEEPEEEEEAPAPKRKASAPVKKAASKPAAKATAKKATRK